MGTGVEGFCPFAAEEREVTEPAPDATGVDATLRALLADVLGLGEARAAAPTPLSLNAWHHVALSWNAGALTLSHFEFQQKTIAVVLYIAQIIEVGIKTMVEFAKTIVAQYK